MRSALATSPDACSSSLVVRATTSPFFASWRWRALRLRGGVAFDGVRATIAAIAWFCHDTFLVGVAGLFSLRVGVFGLRSCLLSNVAIVHRDPAAALAAHNSMGSPWHCLAANERRSERHRYALQRCDCWRQDIALGCPASDSAFACSPER